MPQQQAWVNVETLARTVDDSGPITNFTMLRIKRRMNGAGEFRMIVPATDPRVADTLAQERTIQAYDIVNDTPMWLGGGVITQQRWRKSGDGSPVLEVSGPDLLGELMRTTVGELDLDDSDGGNNLDDILDELPASWSSGKTGSTGDFAARFSHETPLNALMTIAEKLDAVFRNEIDGTDPRNLEWYNTLPSTSQVTLISSGELRDVDDNPYVAIITDIQEVQDSSQIVNRAYFYGAGNGDARLSSSQVDDGTHVWPDDSNTLDSGNYSGAYSTSFDWDDTLKCIDEDNSIATYGVRSAAISFPEISPITNGDTDFDAAMNTLIKSTVHWMERRCEPTKTYTVTVAGLQQDVIPGDIVTVDARFYREDEAPILINNQDLTVLETDTLISDSGVRVVTFTLAERRKYPKTDGQIVADSIIKAQTTERLPQMMQYTNTTSYQLPIDDDNPVALHFWLAEEATFADRVLLRFKVNPFDSMLGYYAGGDGNTAYTNTASTNITLDAHTGLETNSGSGHNHQLKVPGGTVAVGSEAGFDASTNFVNNDAEHTDDTVIQNESSHTHTIDNVAHTGLVNETAHRHTLPWLYVAEDGADTYVATDLEFSVNGSGYSSTGVAAISGAAGWYELDLTAHATFGPAIRGALTLRPATTGGYNYITCRIKSASEDSKTCQIIAQVAATVRAQPLASY